MSVSAVLIASGAGIHRATARIRDGLRSEVSAQGPRWRLWTPVAFGAGCAVYFVLGREPPLWPLVALAIVAGALWSAARRAGRSRRCTLPLLLLACLALGLTTAKVRSARIAAPIAPALSEPTVIEAWVIDVDSPGERGARVVIAPVRVQGLEPAATPHRLRATLRGAPPPPGAAVRLVAILNPPPGPASPGAYDFGRNAWFQGMGGVAFALGETRPAILADAPWRLRLAMAVNRIRYGLAQRIVARLGERNGGIAAAMTTGHETWIRRADLEVMRDSGLAHILSISGLHMAIVGGFVFFLTRLGVAAWPWLALRVPGKKVAACAGLGAVATYLIVSGAPPPAERAAVTASIAFAAILLDRQAITMNALATAAFVVLLLQPEAIVTPGFQMSFAATAALVALSEVWPRRVRELSAPWPIVTVQRIGSWTVAACAASLVAGLATGPFAMQHFNRTAVYGLLANLGTSPVADFVMMPALALGAVLEPLGLGAPFLWVAARAIEIMMAIGTTVAGLPGAVQTVSSAPAVALPVAFVGVLFICLWRGRLRWLGLPLAAAVMIWPRSTLPALWIGDGGTSAAVVQGRQAMIVRPGVREFATDLWSRRWALTPVDRPDAGWVCDRFSCRPEAGGLLAMSWGRRPPDPASLEALCRSARVISLRAAVAMLPDSCDGRLVLDGEDHGRNGAIELWRDGSGWRVVTAARVRGDRPWTVRTDADVSDSGG